MKNIVLHVYYQGSGSAARSFIEEMQRSGLQQAVKAEDGCLQYDYFLPADAPETALLLEKWRDQTALNAHAHGEVMAKLKTVKERFALETRIERYE